MTNARPSAVTTDGQAALWATKLDLGALSASEEAALDAWLAQDPLHQGALLRAQATLAYIDRGRALAPGGAFQQDVAVAAEKAATPDRRKFLQLSALATTIAAGFGAIVVLQRSSREDIRTDIGEVRRVPLADGSVAVLNTSSRLAVALQAKQRAISLEEGEAWFEVAHDRSRPFIVDAGKVRVRAVGTAFSVRLQPEGADVMVTEGVVETWIEGRTDSHRILRAGARSYAASGTGPASSTIDDNLQEIERTLAWRGGEIALNGQTVDYAVAELNRYNRKRIVIEDPSIGRERLVGYFRTNDPMRFADAVAEMTGSQVVEKEGEIEVKR